MQPEQQNMSRGNISRRGAKQNLLDIYFHGDKKFMSGKNRVLKIMFFRLKVSISAW